MNFYEKALFVKTDVAVALCGRVQLALCPSRAMLLFALPVSPPFSVTRCIMKSIFSATLGALQSSDRSLLSDEPSSHGAVAFSDPKRYVGLKKLWPSATLIVRHHSLMGSSSPLCQ
jgi:hypothetical protein